MLGRWWGWLVSWVGINFWKPSGLSLRTSCLLREFRSLRSQCTQKNPYSSPLAPLRNKKLMNAKMPSQQGVISHCHIFGLLWARSFIHLECKRIGHIVTLIEMYDGRINTCIETGWWCFMINKWSLKKKRANSVWCIKVWPDSHRGHEIIFPVLCAAYLTSSVGVALRVLHYSREHSILVSARIKIPDLIGLIIKFSMS